jgi:hypothetical protein
MTYQICQVKKNSKGTVTAILPRDFPEGYYYFDQFPSGCSFERVPAYVESPKRREILPKEQSAIIDAEKSLPAKKTALVGARTGIIDADRFSLREGK